MDNLIIIAVVAAIIGAAICYIRREKRRGVQCIGCPDAGSCASRGCSGGCSGCGGNCGSRQ